MSPSLDSPWARGLLQLVLQARVALVPRGIDVAALHRLAHRALGLGAMPAVAEATSIDVRPELDEASVQRSGRDPPHADLAQPWRVHHVAAVGKWMHLRAEGGVASLEDGAADLAHAQVEPGIYGVEQRRLPNTRRTEI